MADMKDLLNSKKVQEFKAKKRRPWDQMVSDSEKNSQVGASAEASPGAPNVPPTSTSRPPTRVVKNAEDVSPAGKLEARKIRNQNVNNTEANVYVNKTGYVNDTETDRKQINPPDVVFVEKISSLRNQTVNNTETADYVNKTDYVNDAETKSGPIIKEIFRSPSADPSNQATKNVNTDYVINTRTDREQFVNTETKQVNYVNSTEASSQSSTETERKQNAIYRLSRMETEILSFLMRICVANGSKRTPQIAYGQIAEAASTTAATCKTLVARLIAKGFLERVSFSKGPGSRTVYQIPDESYQAFLMKNHAIMNFEMRSQSVNNTETSTHTRARTEAPSSSSSLYNKETTTKSSRLDPNSVQIPQVLKDAGFGIGAIMQLINQTEWTGDQIQTFFDHYAYDLPSLKVLSPVGYFMKIVKNGTPYESETLLIDEQKTVSEYRARIAALKEQTKDAKMLELGIKADATIKAMAQADIDVIVPPNSFMKAGSDLQLRTLRNKLISEESGQN